MHLKNFIIYWVLAIISIAVFNSVLWFYTDNKNILTVSIISVVVFTILSLTIFLIGEFLLKSANKLLYLSLVMGNMLFKMIVSVVMLLVLREIIGEISRSTIFSFLICYFGFTIFETYLMMRQSDRS